MVEFCPHCSAKIVQYTHRLNKPLVSALIKMYKKYQFQEINISGMLGLTHNQVCNFQKLKYWGFVEKGDKDKGKGGDWKVTPFGERFIKGEISVPERVTTFRGEVVETELSQQVKIDNVFEGYQYRDDYARESQ